VISNDYKELFNGTARRRAVCTSHAPETVWQPSSALTHWGRGDYSVLPDPLAGFER